jgi:myo-inositol-1(or 4)-monophosphatase
MKLDKELKIMIKVAKKAGKLILKNYGKVTFEMKNDNSFVSKIDKESEKIIKTELLSNFPKYGFIGEESGKSNSKNKRVWVVDPLDGTTNYKISNPFFNVSIALSENNIPIYGVVYNPLTKDLFYAKKGFGSYLNKSKLILESENKVLKDSIHTFCFGSKIEYKEKIGKIYSDFIKKGINIRRLGAGALELAYVAAGKTDSFFMVGVNPWDVSAGQLIAKEAGAVVTDFENKEFNINSKHIICSRPKIHDELLKNINN